MGKMSECKGTMDVETMSYSYSPDLSVPIPTSLDVGVNTNQNRSPQIYLGEKRVPHKNALTPLPSPPR